MDHLDYISQNFEEVEEERRVKEGLLNDVDNEDAKLTDSIRSSITMRPVLHHMVVCERPVVRMNSCILLLTAYLLTSCVNRPIGLSYPSPVVTNPCILGPYSTSKLYYPYTYLD